MISVVIPCYNAEDDIRDALSSVLRQTRGDHVQEIIVVDDGSTDGSREAIERLAEHDDRIQYVHQENSGPSVARNTGVERSTQDYVAFLDADDLWLEDKIEKQVSFVRENPTVGLVSTDYYVDGINQQRRRIWGNNFSVQREDNLELFFSQEGPILLSTVIVKLDYFEKLGGFDPTLPKGQDTDMWLRIAAEYPIHHLHEALIVKRERQNSVGADAEVKAKYLHRITDQIVSDYPRLEPLKNKRKSLTEYYLSRYYFDAGNTSGSLKHSFNSVILNPSNMKAYILAMLAMMPLSGDVKRDVMRILNNWRDRLQFRKIA